MASTTLDSFLYGTSTYGAAQDTYARLRDFHRVFVENKSFLTISELNLLDNHINTCEIYLQYFQLIFNLGHFF